MLSLMVLSIRSCVSLPIFLPNSFSSSANCGSALKNVSALSSKLELSLVLGGVGSAVILTSFIFAPFNPSFRLPFAYKGLKRLNYQTHNARKSPSQWRN